MTRRAQNEVVSAVLSWADALASNVADGMVDDATNALFSRYEGILRAALAEIERLRRGYISCKAHDLSECEECPICAEVRERIRAEQAEARADALQQDMTRMIEPLHQSDDPEEAEAVRVTPTYVLMTREAAVSQGEMHHCWRDERDSFKARTERLTEALREIAEHPHISYDHPANTGSTGRDYGIGCADGHRCAASIAVAALREAK